jgi:protein TonB
MLQRPVELPTLTVSPPEQIVRGPVRVGSISNMQGDILIAPPSIPIHTQYINDATDGPIAPPDWKNVVVRPRGAGGDSAFYDLGGRIPVVIPDHAATKPLPISHWAEGNVVHRVPPVYPKIAIQARIHGSVKLRAIISKEGTIENLSVLSGPPMLIQSALDAVRQWRYRPYMLNGEPIAVDTEVTVNFILEGSQ